MILNRRGLKEAAANSLSPHALAAIPPMELPELIYTLQSHFDKVEADSAFLALKQAEVRPDDYISMRGVMDTREQLHIEQSLLVGHAFMIQEMVNRGQMKLDKHSRQILRRVLDYANNMPIRD